MDKHNEHTDFEALLTAFGNASFDCGAWDSDEDGPWDATFEVCEQAKAAVVAYVAKLEASPELYAALEEAVEYVESVDGGGLGSPDPDCQLFNRWKAALAKAKGEAR